MSHRTVSAPAVNGQAHPEKQLPQSPAHESGAAVTAALEFANLGWSVVPLCHPQHHGTHPPTHAKTCTRPGKQPVRKLVPLRSRPFTPDELRRIWTQNPALNVGVLTGTVSRLVMVDVDSQEALEAYWAFLGRPMGETWAFQGGRPLPHFVYRWPFPWAPRGNPLADVHPKLDFLGEDMLSVMPPSLHKTGVRYRWTHGGPGSGVSIAECPERLVHLLRDVAEQDRPRGGGISQAAPPDGEAALIRRAVEYARACDPAVSGSGGRKQTFKVACKLLHGFGLGVDATLSVLATEWNPRCSPPWAEEELRKEVEGARDRGHCPRIEEKHFEPARPASPALPSTNAEPPKPAHKASDVLPGRPASQLRKKEVSWLMEGYVPKGLLTLVVGQPNTGKSTFLAYLLTKAKRALYLPGFEEDPDLSLMPRLEAHGVDLEAVHILDQGCWKMPNSRERLTRAVKHHGSELVVVDPVTSYISEGGSENDPKHVRDLLEGFLRVAIDTGAAVVAVRHPGKDPNNVMRGSGAWREVPRNIVELMCDPGPPVRRLIQLYKDGFGQVKAPRVYDLVGESGKAKVFTLLESVSQDDASRLKDTPDFIERFKIDQARDLLCRLLGNGEVESRSVFSAGEVERLNERTLRRAAQALGVKIRRDGIGMDHRSYWSLPAQTQEGGAS